MHERILEQFLKVKSVTTDTRKIPADAIFFCLKGANFNGNQFAKQALHLGASMVVADEADAKGEERIVIVENALSSLQELARDYRLTFSIPFLAITGSNGKTTTKELMRDLLTRKYRVHATQGNLNNHIGVPLTLLSMPPNTEFAIIEMGANHQGEIKSYCQYALPDYGLITNMGKAHLEGFGGIEGVRRGKKELYDFVHATGGKLFVNTELQDLREAAQGMDTVEYGFQTGGLNLNVISESPSLVYASEYSAMRREVATQLAGAYNLYNIASAVAVGRYFGVNENQIHDAIEAYTPENNRSQLLKTANNILIMDAYNANPSSMEHALMSLSRQNDKHKFFVMGDMRELGEESEVEHRLILAQAASLGLNGVVVGPIFKKLENEFSFPAFNDNNEAREYLDQLELENHLILVKGSRGIRLEEVVSAL
ncbi:MAG: UDP-N-acetylmuramoyl-tripeptide--D-alanyl-D-alanine ligase [Flavobacteriales bacterium]